MIRLFHADGGMPNLALMRLETYFLERGERVEVVRVPVTAKAAKVPQRTLFHERADAQYGSSIFTFSGPKRAALERTWGPIVWGGTGVCVTSSLDEIDASVAWDRVRPCYRTHPDFLASMGFIARGCRLACSFCQVHDKEGKPAAVALPLDVWRGDPYPRHLELLDNDAFSPTLRDHWREAVRQIREGGFRVCFSQGINIRFIDDEAAATIASIRYCGHDFDKRRLYTAWDNLGDEARFKAGVATLARHGVPASHLRVYMLVGYDKHETWERIFYRHAELAALGCEPYPMVYNKAARPDLGAFARWGGGDPVMFYKRVPWPEYHANLKPDVRAESDAAWARVAGGWKPARKLAVVA